MSGSHALDIARVAASPLASRDGVGHVRHVLNACGVSCSCNVWVFAHTLANGMALAAEAAAADPTISTLMHGVGWSSSHCHCRCSLSSCTALSSTTHKAALTLTEDSQHTATGNVATRDYAAFYFLLWKAAADGVMLRSRHASRGLDDAQARGCRGPGACGRGGDGQNSAEPPARTGDFLDHATVHCRRAASVKQPTMPVQVQRRVYNMLAGLGFQSVFDSQVAAESEAAADVAALPAPSLQHGGGKSELDFLRHRYVQVPGTMLSVSNVQKPANRGVMLVADPMCEHVVHSIEASSQAHSFLSHINGCLTSRLIDLLQLPDQRVSVHAAGARKPSWRPPWACGVHPRQRKRLLSCGRAWKRRRRRPRTSAGRWAISGLHTNDEDTMACSWSVRPLMLRQRKTDGRGQ